MNDYEIIEKAVAMYKINIRGERKKYLEKKELAEEYGLTRLAKLYSELINIYDEEIESFLERN